MEGIRSRPVVASIIGSNDSYRKNNCNNFNNIFHCTLVQKKSPKKANKTMKTTEETILN